MNRSHRNHRSLGVLKGAYHTDGVIAKVIYNRSLEIGKLLLSKLAANAHILFALNPFVNHASNHKYPTFIFTIGKKAKGCGIGLFPWRCRHLAVFLDPRTYCGKGA